MLKTVLLGCVFTVCLAGVGLAQDAGVTYTMTIESAEIKHTKENGNAWDFDTDLPDCYVKCAVVVPEGTKPEIRKTRVVRETFHPIWNQTVLKVRPGDWVYLLVADSDFADDDIIGGCKMHIMSPAWQEGSMDVSFGQVKRLTVRFQQ